jgi:PAS domain-containing protein
MALLVLCGCISLVVFAIVRGINAQLKQLAAEMFQQGPQLENKTGTLADMETKAAQIFSKATFRTILGIARGITERNRVNEALRQSEEKLRQLAENIREVFG